MLRRTPEERPTAPEILQRLGREPFTPPVGAAASREVPLLGRDKHLQFLAEAYAASQRQQAVLVAVHGPSGIGKSALLRHFLDGLREKDDAVILAGRCYEHESVPYKALDPLVDELARYLRSLWRDEAAKLLPQDVGPLTRIFPVLGSVDAVARAARSTSLLDPHEVRRQAFAALRELLTRVGQRQPLILHIDDLQWGDLDSVYLLTDLLRSPAPPLLLVTSYRSEDVNSPCLRALRQALEQDQTTDRRELAVAPLTEAETQELVLHMLGEGAVERAAEIARESGGNPFFITEMVQASQAGTAQSSSPAAGKITLDGLIRARANTLPEGARQLLEIVAVSGRPLGEMEACKAAGVLAEGRTHLAHLEAARFIRGIGTAAAGVLETYHDRIRETVVAGLAPETRQGHHRQIALVLEATGQADPEAVAVHFEGAKEGEKAGSYYVQAATKAAEALAFDQAANFYQKSLDLRPLEGTEGRELRTKLGDALANAGRGTEAGPMYLTAAEGAEGLQGLELRRRAMEQLLLAGRTEEGIRILNDLLGTVGQRLPVGYWHSVGSMIW